MALAQGPVIQLKDLPDVLTLAEDALAGDTDLEPLPQTAEPLPPPPSRPIEGNGTLSQVRQEVEMRKIRAALEKHRNNRLRAAAELGISRMGLYKKLHKYGLIESEAV